ncbi:SDR family oxidoreductase [Roseospira marina]|uniref:SDR family oxidoreductase n=1 Tax=Roseospira marina TaxID=140057 RepID=A0A5M6IFZ8_9PROT|nr:SDR family oxidoreductase [Roseospira marina]KAA5607220.1 SDR family oxidoreductase [Roseospira marina]MBB4312630.1 NAD(P)-dependent dehydrogenase (short-subunit alcohol dehydrogenase family) [Roseospira marina]MBB5085354.1 NAD(P)-dependent dehydrogenase (short-subunit alcohol dehydrogenase family) [Roseospira marina]
MTLDRPDTIPPFALVTGAGRRIGRALAEEMAAAGCAVALHYREAADEVAETQALIEDAGGRAVAVRADLSVEAETTDLVVRAADALGGAIGVLVNNASAFDYDRWDSATRASWDHHLEPNLRAPFVLTQAMARGLPEGAEGLVLNMIDQRVWNLTPHFVSYTVSKAGLWTLTQTLALALAPRVRVNAIGPGPALPSPRQSQAQFDAQCAAMPLQRGTSVAEIRQAARFILAARSMTGQMIALDGGQHLAWAWSANGGLADPPEE